MMLTQARLKELLHYDPETGLWTRLIAQGNGRPGPIHVAPSNQGYLRLNVMGKRYQAHNIVWLYMTGSWPEFIIDHADTDKTNNRWNNLRIAGKQLNGANRRKNKNNRSGHKGVSWSNQSHKWQASIMINGKSKHLGFFEDILLAAKVYEKAAQLHFNEFARVV